MKKLTSKIRIGIINQSDDSILALVKDLDFQPFGPRLRRKSQSEDFKVFRQISKFYKIRFRLRKGKGDFYSDSDREIQLDSSEILLKTLCAVFSHELAHHFQGRFYRRKKIKFNENSLAEHVAYERQAERLAYYICKKLFSPKIHWKPQSFSAYRSKIDRTFLQAYHGARNDTGKKLLTPPLG